MLDDSALRECDESRSTRYSERHSAQIAATPGVQSCRIVGMFELAVSSWSSLLVEDSR